MTLDVECVLSCCVHREKWQTLDAKGRGVAFRQREPKERTVLDDLK
jgi:hypothetical protein